MLMGKPRRDKSRQPEFNPVRLQELAVGTYNDHQNGPEVQSTGWKDKKSGVLSRILRTHKSEQRGQRPKVCKREKQDPY